MSLIDRYPLTQEIFEDKIIAVGAKKNVICTIFRKTPEEMDAWCQEVYQMDFNTTYEILKQLTYMEWKECLKALGTKGNPTAMTIMQERLAEDAEEQASGIVFNVNVKVENADEKCCNKTSV